MAAAAFWLGVWSVFLAAIAFAERCDRRRAEWESEQRLAAVAMEDHIASHMEWVERQLAGAYDQAALNGEEFVSFDDQFLYDIGIEAA